jgi:hypothetical protein
MSPARAVMVLACAIAVTGCSLPTGGHHRGAQCTSVTFLNEDFSSGALANWFTLFGQPIIDASVGDPAPSARLSNANMQSNAKFQTTPTCGLSLSVAVRHDTGVALIRIVVPGIQRVAQVQAFDSSVVYLLCQPGGCIKQVQSVTPDTTWHVYEYRAITDSAITQWSRDGVVQFSVGGAGASYDSLRVNLGVFPTGSAGTGPSRGFFDNVLATSP